jgi:hypothetical protein
MHASDASLRRQLHATPIVPYTSARVAFDPSKLPGLQMICLAEDSLGLHDKPTRGAGSQAQGLHRWFNARLQRPPVDVITASVMTCRAGAEKRQLALHTKVAGSRSTGLAPPRRRAAPSPRTLHSAEATHAAARGCESCTCLCGLWRTSHERVLRCASSVAGTHAPAGV